MRITPDIYNGIISYHLPSFVVIVNVHGKPFLAIVAKKIPIYPGVRVSGLAVFALTIRAYRAYHSPSPPFNVDSGSATINAPQNGQYLYIAENRVLQPQTLHLLSYSYCILTHFPRFGA